MRSKTEKEKGCSERPHFLLSLYIHISQRTSWLFLAFAWLIALPDYNMSWVILARTRHGSGYTNPSFTGLSYHMLRLLSSLVEREKQFIPAYVQIMLA